VIRFFFSLVRAAVRHMPDCIRPITGDGRIEVHCSNKFVDAKLSMSWGTVPEWERPWAHPELEIRRMTPELYRRRTGTWPMPQRRRAEERPS
jgi:hypothetical protein